MSHSVTQAMVITDGVDQALVSAAGALQVEVVSGGTAGTQYTEGDTDATITGTAVMWEDAGDTLRSVSAAKPLPVNVVAGGSGGGGLLSPQTSTSVSASIAPAGTATFDSTQISSGKTGKLLKVVPASSSGNWKAELRTVLNGTASGNKLVWFGNVGAPMELTSGFISQVESATVGFDGFRVVMTNLDAAKTEDLYCSFMWDEV